MGKLGRKVQRYVYKEGRYVWSVKGRLESGEIEKEVVRLVDGESWWVGRKVSKEQGTEVCIQRRQERMEHER